MPAEDLHPGARAALERLGMNETDVAHAIARGELPSPQRFANSLYVALRITGTGAAYRKALDEYAWRDPSLYLNERFLARCNGLPVIVEHPEKEMLDSQEYADRNIGAVVYPYVGREGIEDAAGDEVWGVGRIIDRGAADYLEAHRLSTSPAVVFGPGGSGERIKLDDKKHLLIEADPALLDHLAICDLGVWDRSGGPAGIIIDDEEKRQDMAERDDTKARDDKARDDAADAKLDAIADAVKGLADTVKGLHARMDAHDKARADAEEAGKKEAEAAEEHRQAEELERLAGEERTEAERLEEEARGDAAGHRLARRDGESCEDHSKRADALARKHDAGHFAKRDDESRDDHSKRIDALVRRHAGLKTRRDAAEDTLKAEEKKPSGDVKADAKKRDDEDEEEREREAELEKEIPYEAVIRHDGEDDASYSKRMDRAVRGKLRMPHLARRHDESAGAHCGRMDAVVRRIHARKDTEALVRDANDKAEKAGADAAKARADAEHARKDAEDLRQRMLERSDEDHEVLAQAQARADDALLALGERSMRPVAGETPLLYRIRTARALQRHSAAWKDTDLGLLARTDAKAFENVERQIYADADLAARTPSNVPAGLLREIKKRGPGGLEIVEFAGRPLAWMSDFMTPGQTTTRLGLKRSA